MRLPLADSSAANTAPAGPAPVFVGSHDVHLHLARRIAAQPGTILHEDNPGSVPGRGHRRADAGHATARDEEVALDVHRRHVWLAREAVCGWLRRRNGIEASIAIGAAPRSGLLTPTVQTDQHRVAGASPSD